MLAFSHNIIRNGVVNVKPTKVKKNNNDNDNETFNFHASRMSRLGTWSYKVWETLKKLKHFQICGAKNIMNTTIKLKVKKKNKSNGIRNCRILLENFDEN